MMPEWKINVIPEADKSDIYDSHFGRESHESDLEWCVRRLMNIIGFGASQKDTLEAMKNFITTLHADLMELRRINK